MTNAYRDIPGVDTVLAEPALASLLAGFRRDIVIEAVRTKIGEIRAGVARGEASPTSVSIAEDVARDAEAMWSSWPTSVINATGVILHTNLGRAPLSEESLRAVTAAAIDYSDLEVEMESGKRGSRHTAIAR